MKKVNLIKALTAAALLVVVGCNKDEATSDLESSQQSGLSSKSVKLDIQGIEAENEQSSNPASDAIDSDEESRWSGYGNPLDLVLDLGTQQQVDYINIAFHKGDDRKNSFYVYTSNNASENF